MMDTPPSGTVKPPNGTQDRYRFSIPALVENSVPLLRRDVMRVRVLLQITTDDGALGDIEEIASLVKNADRAKDLALSLVESKVLLAAVHQRIVEAQAGLTSFAKRPLSGCVGSDTAL
jgi:hypothetical protein